MGSTGEVWGGLGVLGSPGGVLGVSRRSGDVGGVLGVLVVPGGWRRFPRGVPGPGRMLVVPRGVMSVLGVSPAPHDPPGPPCRSPTPAVRWQRLNGPLPGRAALENFNKTLRLRAVEEADDGEYECVAENSQGSARRSHFVTVEGTGGTGGTGRGTAGGWETLGLGLGALGPLGVGAGRHWGGCWGHWGWLGGTGEGSGRTGRHWDLGTAVAWRHWVGIWGTGCAQSGTGGTGMPWGGHWLGLGGPWRVWGCWGGRP